MRIVFFIFSCFIVTKIAAQSIDTTYNNVYQGKELKKYLDSLKVQILADTSKFRQKDLIFTTLGRQNQKPYSKLFIVNGAYIYKLDIIKGTEVLEFVNEILDYKKIKSISYVDSSIASTHFGKNAWPGIILVTMVDKVKFNPKVAGLVRRKNRSGDNFTTRKEGEILIRD